ncbi:hypothetical protein Hanom_Chr09g00842291 [Helianthus anomalus]
MWRIFVLNVVKLSLFYTRYVCLSILLFVWLVELSGSCLTVGFVKTFFVYVTALYVFSCGEMLFWLQIV